MISKRRIHNFEMKAAPTQTLPRVITTAITMTITNAAPCVSCSSIVIKSHRESNNARRKPERRQVTILLKDHADDAVIFYAFIMLLDIAAERSDTLVILLS